jgi:hypothetical protein
VVEREYFTAGEPRCTSAQARAILTCYAAIVGLGNREVLRRADSAMIAHGATLEDVQRSVRTEQQARSLLRNLERLYTMAEGRWL